VAIKNDDAFLTHLECLVNGCHPSEFVEIYCH